MLNDILGFSVILLYTIGCFFVSLYIYVHYAHIKERDFIYSSIYKAFIIMGFTIPAVVLFIIPIDKLCKTDMRRNDFGFEFDLELPMKISMFFLLFCFFANIFARIFYNQSLNVGLRTRFFRAGRVTLLSVLAYLVMMAFTYFLYNNGIIFRTTLVLGPFLLIGSFLFSVIGGVGLAALPLRFFQSLKDVKNRPTAEEIVLGKQVLLEENKRILKLASSVNDLQVEIEVTSHSNRKEAAMKKVTARERSEQVRIEYTLFDEFYRSYKESLPSKDRQIVTEFSNFFIGLGGSLFSVYIFLGVIAGIFGFHDLLDYPLENTNIFIASTLFLTLSLYMVSCMVKGIGLLSNILLKYMETYEFRINGTWSDTFLMSLNVLFVAVLGQICFFSRFLPKFMFETVWSIVMKNIVKNVNGLNLLYNIKFFEIIFIVSFVMALLWSVNNPRNSQKIQDRINEKIRRLKADKKKVSILQAKV